MGCAGTENAESVPTRHFQFKHFWKSKITSESRFLKKYYTFVIQKKKMKRFDQYFKKVKKWILHFIFKFLGRGQINFLEIAPYIFRVLGPILAI